MCYLKRKLQEMRKIKLDEDDTVMSQMIIKRTTHVKMKLQIRATSGRMNLPPSYSMNWSFVEHAVLHGPAVTSQPGSHLMIQMEKWHNSR